MIGMPNIPGLSSDPHSIISAGVDALISFGGAFAIGLLFDDQWGVYSQYGVPVLLADNVTSVEHQSTANVLSAPVEMGSFASYNKVQDPYTATVQMTRGGGNAAMRGAFIAQLEALQKSTLLFHIVTPEYVHRNASITGFGYKRQPNDGNRIIVANLSFKEVREVSVAYTTEEVANPEDQPVVEEGVKEAVPVGQNTSILAGAAGAISDFVTDIRDNGIGGLFGGGATQ